MVLTGLVQHDLRVVRDQAAEAAGGLGAQGGAGRAGGGVGRRGHRHVGAAAHAGAVELARAQEAEREVLVAVALARAGQQRPPDARRGHGAGLDRRVPVPEGVGAGDVRRAEPQGLALGVGADQGVLAVSVPLPLHTAFLTGVVAGVRPLQLSRRGGGVIRVGVVWTPAHAGGEAKRHQQRQAQLLRSIHRRHFRSLLKRAQRVAALWLNSFVCLLAREKVLYIKNTFSCQ